jgi:hypothetical protein
VGDDLAKAEVFKKVAGIVFCHDDISLRFFGCVRTRLPGAVKLACSVRRLASTFD